MTGADNSGRAGVEDDERSEPLAAGWEPDEGEGGTIWRDPQDGDWYEQGRAIQIPAGGEDASHSD